MGLRQEHPVEPIVGEAGREGVEDLDRLPVRAFGGLGLVEKPVKVGGIAVERGGPLRQLGIIGSLRVELLEGLQGAVEEVSANALGPAHGRQAGLELIEDVKRQCA